MTANTTKPLRLYSYTRCASDDECQRKRYLAREWGGTGLQLLRDAWPLVHGNIVHKALEDFVKQGSIDYKAVASITRKEALDAGFDIIEARDWGAVVAGQLWGFVNHVWPYLMAEYEVIEAEKWITMDSLIDDVTYRFRARQDLLLRNRFDGHLLYVDYKNTSSTKPRWIAAWNKSAQLHSSMHAIQQTTDFKVERALVIGLYKGYRDDKLKTQRSIFSYGWVNREYSMTPAYHYEYQRSRGWELFPVADEFEDPAEWFSKMPQEILAAQFLQTAPIFYRKDIAEEYFAQQLIREAHVAHAESLLQEATTVEQINEILRTYYKQNFSHCTPAYGFDCPFNELCWIESVKADPLGSGLFKRYESDIEEE